MFIRRSIIVLSAVLVAAGMSTATASAQVVGEREASRRFDTAIRAAEALRELVATDSLDAASLRRWDRVHGRAVQRVFDRAPRVGVPARARGSRCLAVATCHLACNTAASEVLSARESLAFGLDEVEPRALVTELAEALASLRLGADEAMALRDDGEDCSDLPIVGSSRSHILGRSARFEDVALLLRVARDGAGVLRESTSSGR